MSLVERRIKRRERALLIAQMIRDGGTLASIARIEGCSRENLRQIMANACPPFVEGAPVPRRKPSARNVWVVNPEPPEPEPRPAWSYPDAVTLALVAQIRREMGQPQ